MERSSLAATVAERDALNQHLQVPNIIATGQEGLIRAFADVSVLEAGGLRRVECPSESIRRNTPIETG